MSLRTPTTLLRRAAFPALLLAAVLVLCSTRASAQVVRLDTADGGTTVITPYGPQFGFRDETDSQKFVWVFMDGVEVVQEGRRLRGKTLVAVIRRGGADPGVSPDAAASGAAAPEGSLQELYLEGDVTIEEGDERLFGAESVYYNDPSGRMIILEGQLRIDVDPEMTGGRPGAIIIRFEQMRRLSANESVLEGVTYSNCEYEHRHWYVRTDKVLVRETNHGTVLTTGDNFARVNDTPVLWWPGVRFNLDGGRIPLRKVTFGSSTRFGTENVTWWGGEADDITASVVDLFGFDGEDATGEWELMVGLYSRRGVFFQPSFNYETKASKGTLLLAYINDTANTDTLDEPVPQNQRWRIDLEHRTHISDTQTLDIEYSKISDDQFLEEYYQSEYRTGKEQETYVNYLDVVDNRAVQVLFRVRLNDWDTQVEYLPQIEQYIIGESVGDIFGTPAFVSARGLISNARIRYDDDEDDAPPDSRVVRTGGTATVDLPIDVGGDRVVVSGGANLMHFSDSIDDGATTRVGGAGKVTWSRTYSGVDASRQSELWNIDGMRRIVEPMIGYENVFSLNREPSDLIQIDSIETLKRFQEFFVSVRDRIQTHQNGKVVTILDTEITVPFYFNPDRDNEQEGTGDGEVEGNIRVDSTWSPGANIEWLRNADVRWRALIDPNSKEFVESFLRYQMRIDQDRSFMIANNKGRDEFHFVTVGTEWILTPRYRFAVFASQDLLDNEEDETGVVLRQVAHRWYIDTVFAFERGESDSGKNEDEYSLSLRLSPTFGGSPGETLLDTISQRVR